MNHLTNHPKTNTGMKSKEEVVKEIRESSNGSREDMITEGYEAGFAAASQNNQGEGLEYILRDMDTNQWYWCKCENCGWEDSSEFCVGCHPIGDTGDCTDPLCPVCGSNKIEGDATLDVPQFEGVVSIKIPIELYLSPYIKELKRLQQENEDRHWSSMYNESDVPLSTLPGTTVQGYSDAHKPKCPKCGSDKISDGIGTGWEVCKCGYMA